MEDLKNKKLYKIVWLPDKNEIFWELRNEELLAGSNKTLLANYLGKYINIDDWYFTYNDLYYLWLNEDCSDIYNINSDVNLRIINAIKRVNNDLEKENIILFYWFDVDRSMYPNFEWVTDPLEHRSLITLDSSYNKNNGKVSLEQFLVFPIID